MSTYYPTLSLRRIMKLASIPEDFSMCSVRFDVRDVSVCQSIQSAALTIGSNSLHTKKFHFDLVTPYSLIAPVISLGQILKKGKLISESRKIVP